tara:strand:- start:8860 stop:9468 length:609 start_codon:yes stop_codon:yes gene_type:complete
MDRTGPTPKINPDRMQKAIPGWSLTQEPQKWNWESPPQQTDPNAVVSNILDQMEQPEVEATFGKLMLAGVSAEEIATSISMAGFMYGEFSVDVAELIKPQIAFYLMGMADKYGIPAHLYAKDSDAVPDEGMSDETILDLMKVRNPDLYEFMLDRDNAITAKAQAGMKKPPSEPRIPSGFIDAELQEGDVVEVTEPEENEDVG